MRWAGLGIPGSPRTPVWPRCTRPISLVLLVDALLDLHLRVFPGLNRLQHRTLPRGVDPTPVRPHALFVLNPMGSYLPSCFLDSFEEL